LFGEGAWVLGWAASDGRDAILFGRIGFFGFGLFGKLAGGEEKHGAATVGAAAVTGEAFALGLRDWCVYFEFIVVDEFLPGGNVFEGFNVDVSFVGVGDAVGLAGVVDETGLVTTDAGVYDGALVEGKEEGVPVFLLVLGAAFCLGGGDVLADIFDDAGALRDGANGEGAESVDAGGAEFEIGLGGFGFEGGYGGHICP
jgi:hypothetical protein